MHKGWRACLAVSIDSFTSPARSHASWPAVFWQKVNCTSESPSPAECTFFIREHPAVFFVTAVMALFSESNDHCEVAEVLTMPKKYNP